MKKYQKLKESKEYRNAFVESQINIGIPFQVRALRKQRKWDQKTLAQQAGMAQPRISAIERPGHGTLNLRTLLSLASAFNVGLMVRFVPFSELYQWEDSFSPDTFEVPSINEEPRHSFSEPARPSRGRKWSDMTNNEQAAVLRVLELIDGYLSMQDQNTLQAWDGGVMTWGELRQHIQAAIRLISPHPDA